MVKSELIEALALELRIPWDDSEAFLNALVELIYEELGKGGRVMISGFGTFSAKKVAPTIRRNPATKELMKLPSHKRPKFLAGTRFKQLIK